MTSSNKKEITGFRKNCHSFSISWEIRIFRNPVILFPLLRSFASFSKSYRNEEMLLGEIGALGLGDHPLDCSNIRKSSIFWKIEEKLQLKKLGLLLEGNWWVY